jgi:hypothetical protein
VGQTTLPLDSSRPRFSVSVEKVVNLGRFESLRIGLAQSYDVGTVAPDEAFRALSSKVEEWAASKTSPSAETSQTGHGSPTLQSSKPAGLTVDILCERLAGLSLSKPWTAHLEVIEALDAFVVRPRHFLGDVWGDVNA